MTSTRSPRVALALLNRFTSGNEALIGDIVEEYQARGSRMWLWRQVLLAAIVRPSYHRGASGAARAGGGSLFNLDPVAHPANSPITPALNLPPVRINMSGIQAEGVGGLGLLAIIITMTLVMPAAWWLAVFGLVGGAILGSVLVMLHRRYGLSDGKGEGPGEIFDLHDAPRSHHA